MTISTKAIGNFTIFSILFFAVTAHSQTSGSIYTLQKGTKIRVRMDNEINSKVSSINDTFTTTISAPVIVREIEVLPVGTVIEGRIVRVKNASIGKQSGFFEIKFETLLLPQGVKRQIDGSLVPAEASAARTVQTANAAMLAGGTGIGALVGSIFGKTKGALVGAAVGLGIGTGVVWLQKGKEARIKAGEEISISLNREVNLPPEDY
jgi:hypothetical protein